MELEEEAGVEEEEGGVPEVMRRGKGNWEEVKGKWKRKG